MSPHIEAAQRVNLSSLACLEEVIVIGHDGYVGVAQFASYARFTQRVTAAREAQLGAFEQSRNSVEGVMIQFTSGTTGHPKCSVLTHRYVVAVRDDT